MKRTDPTESLLDALKVLDLPPCPVAEVTRVKNGKLVAASDAWKVGYMQSAMRRVLGHRDTTTH